MGNLTPNTNAQYVLNKIATNAAYRRAFVKFAEEEAAAAAEPSRWDKVKAWGQKQWDANKGNLGSLGLGAVAGAGTYGLSGLIPGVKKQQALRLLLGLMAGAGTAAYGNEIQAGIGKGYNYVKDNWFKGKKDQGDAAK